MFMLKTILRIVLAAFMVFAGVMHFVRPDGFVKIVPDYLPWPVALVYISGAFEIAGGIGLMIPSLQRPAAWGLIALYLAVFPANIHMATHHLSFGRQPTPDWLLWLRLPLQAVLIAWAAWYT